MKRKLLGIMIIGLIGMSIFTACGNTASNTETETQSEIEIKLPTSGSSISLEDALALKPSESNDGDNSNSGQATTTYTKYNDIYTGKLDTTGDEFLDLILTYSPTLLFVGSSTGYDLTGWLYTDNEYDVWLENLHYSEDAIHDCISAAIVRKGGDVVSRDGSYSFFTEGDPDAAAQEAVESKFGPGYAPYCPTFTKYKMKPWGAAESEAFETTLICFQYVFMTADADMTLYPFNY